MRQKAWFQPLIHIAAWLAYFSLPFLLQPFTLRQDMRLTSEQQEQLRELWPWLMLFIYGLMVPLFYLNTEVLAPRLMTWKRYGWFIGSQLVLVAMVYGVVSITFSYIRPAGIRHIPSNSIVLNCALIIATSVAYRLVTSQAQQMGLKKERETETLKSELQFLRWQISPHFLFNVLNNLVALARIKSDRLEPMLLRLSGLMRYMLYETDERKISLDKEAEYLQDFMVLQTMRFGDSVRVHADIKVPFGRSFLLEPMLLIPFVENAFKHGIGLVESPEIFVTLFMEGETLNFEVRNKFTPRTSTKDATSGIGLSNVQRRLKLLYADRHQLTIERNNDWFTIRLQIQLQ